MLDGEIGMADSARVIDRAVETITIGDMTSPADAAIHSETATSTTMVEMMVGIVIENIVAEMTIFAKIGDDHLNEIEVSTTTEEEEDRDGSVVERLVMLISGIIQTKVLI